MRTILRRVQVDWGVRKTGELLDLAKVLYHWTKRDFPPLLTYIIFNNMIAIIFRTFTRDKQSFSPSGGWTKRSPPRGNNPCQLGDVRWQRHLPDLPMASYFCQVSCWWWWWWGSLWPFSPSLPDISVWLAKHSETASVQERPKTHLRAMSENALEKYHHHNCPHRHRNICEGAGTVAGKWFREHFRSSRAFFPHRWWKNLTFFYDLDKND